MDNINNEEENFLNKISSEVSRSEEILIEAIAYESSITTLLCT